MFYICALYDDKRTGSFPQLFTEDPAALERFAEHYDRPGMSIYQCVGTLRPNTRKRNLDTVAALAFIHVDIDLRTLATSREQVLGKLTELSRSLPFEIRDSGGGFHIILHLKEPAEANTVEFDRTNAAREALTAMLCGDPTPDHACALLRRVGTHNYKYGEPRLCQVLQPGAPVDITDVEAFLELYDARPQFEAKPKTNGHDHSESAKRDGPVDVEDEFAAMEPGNVNATQTRIIPALVWRGTNLNEIVDYVADATMAMIARTGNPENWIRENEVRRVQKGVHSALRNLFLKEYDYTTGMIPPWLCADYHEKWAAILAEGRRPDFGLNPQGFYVRRAQQSGSRAEEQTEDSGSGNTKERPKGFVIKPFVPFDPARLPPRQWLYSRHYLRRTVSATTAPGGFGKSSLDMVEALAMATCRDLLGEQPTERLRVWLHNGEDNLDEMMRRVAAICQHYSIEQTELVGWFFMTSGNEVPLRVAEGYNKLNIDRQLIDRINTQIEENGLDVVTLDPLITLHGVPESDNTKMDSVIRIFAGIADAHDCAIEISHHMRKPAAGTNGDYAAADIRGASAIHDAVRSARILNRMAEKEASDLVLQEHERAKYFRVDKAKGNYSQALKAVWRQFVNVQLPNGDDVGVVVPWNYPGQGEATPERQEQERVADFVFLQLVDRFALEGRGVSERWGKNYAPAQFAEEAEAKIAKLNRVMLKAAMLRLFKAGKIRAVDEGSGGKATHKIVRA